MKIAHVVDGYPPSQGFIHRWVRRLSHALVARGHVIQVLTLVLPAERPDDPRFVDWGPVDLDDGVPVRRCRTSAPLVALRRAFRQKPVNVRSTELQSLLWRRRSAYDLIHLHGTEPPHALWAWICSRVAGRALVISPHLNSDRAFSSATTRWLFRHAEAVIVSDPQERQLLQRARPRRLIQVGTPAPDPTPADKPAPSSSWFKSDGLQDKGYLLVFAGACDWKSGVLTFIDAVRLLRLDGWPAVAAVVGDYGPWQEHMRRLWRTTLVPILEVPVLHPSNRSSLLAEGDVVILSTDWRTGDVFEAWAAGTPALAPRGTDSPLAEELLPRFSAGNPLALFRAIVRLLRDTGTQGLVTRGRAHLAQAPSWAEVGARVETAYRDVLLPSGPIPEDPTRDA